MAKQVRLTMEVSDELHGFLHRYAREKGVPVDTVVERAILAVQRFKEQRVIGRKHLGFVADRTKLDAELILFP